MKETVHNHSNSPLGLAIVGIGGAVGTTAVAGIELIRSGKQTLAGLPLAEFGNAGLCPYENLRFQGWDLFDVDLRTAAESHNVLTPNHLESVGDALAKIKPWPAISNRNYCAGVTREKDNSETHRELIATIQDQLQRFSHEIQGRVVMINLASTEHAIDGTDKIFSTIEAFEEALDNNHPGITPAMLYAYAAIALGVGYGNFTPSRSADIPALRELALQKSVPLAGKDGKTGQTFIKTVIAPALRARALHVDGWFSTNILGNRDGEALRAPGSLDNKVGTKGDVLESCLGYPVEDHLIRINYYKPRGDDKEAWDNIDVSGFLGQPMQLKVNFLCKDSILAAPLAIEIARCLDLAAERGEGGVIEALSAFFKAPATVDGRAPDHSFPKQQQALVKWLTT